MKAIVLIFAIVLFTTFVNAEQTLKLQVLATSNRHYLAVAPKDAVVETARIEIKESTLLVHKWIPMQHSGSFWELHSSRPITGFRFPLTVRLTSVNGETVTSLVLLAGSLNLPILDLGVQYTLTAPIVPPPKSGSVAPVPAPLVCSGSAKIMVPLYSAPGAEWDLIAENGRLVKTVAIIKPVGTPDAAYIEYMQKLHDAGVDMIGYVATTFGNRDLEAVKAIINDYAVNYPHLSGIYLDQVSASSAKLPYYQELYAYITSMPGWTYDVINPGMIPDAAFNDVATQVVSFEDFGASVASSSVPTWATCEQREKFVAIAHSVTVANMRSMVDALFNKQYIGYIYVTDGAVGTTYNMLASYYSSLASYISSKQL